MNLLQAIFKPITHVPKYQSDGAAIRDITDPEYVVIPLEYPGQILFKPEVKAGDTVCQNQIIGRSSLGSCVHASISGVVKEIKTIWTVRSFNVPAVVIERNDQPPMSMDEMFERYGQPFESASTIQKLRASGVISSWTTPGRFHLEADVDEYPEVKHIVIKGVNEEPTIFANEKLLEENPKMIVQGIRLLRDIAPRAVISLTVPLRLVEWAKQQFPDLTRVVGIGDEYKDRIERLVVSRVTGAYVPNTMPYRKKGIGVLSVEYLLTMVDALERTRPFITKCVTVASCHESRSVTVRIPLGTPIKIILDRLNWPSKNYARILVGGPMKGIAQYSDETPLTKSSHGLFLMTDDCVPDETVLTCVNCGCCTKVCPINLQVHLIGRYVEYNMIEEARRYHVEACNECGLCAYCCPAHRPLVQLIRMCNQSEK